MSDCLFCRIVAGEVPAEVVHRTERALAFRDIAPQAPTHLLVIPLEHHDDLPSAVEADTGLVADVLAVAAAVARQEGLDGGFRLVANTGRDGGQTVGHLHVHVLGGRRMSWPPG
jgi:histidine triad (HIT) family protein